MSTIHHNTPEEQEKSFRATKSSQNADVLRGIFGLYVIENKQYNAYAFAFDFYEIAKHMLDELAQNYEYDFLYDVFLVFCIEGDKERAITLAVMLVDDYRQTNDFEKIIAVNKMLTDTFKAVRSSTPRLIILKAAIDAAICIVESITTELPSDELATSISETLSYLPTCIYDADFMLTSINRIAACYASEYEPQLVVIAAFLPAIKQGLEILRKHFEGHLGVGGLEGEALNGIIEVCNEYHDMLFAVEHPKLTSGEPYRLTKDTKEMDRHIAMLREEQDVVHGLMNITEENRDKLPGLKERYERLIDYFKGFEGLKGVHYSEIEAISHIAYCIAAWRKADIDYTVKTIEPYAQRLLDLVPDDNTSTGAIYAIQTNLTYISEIYAYAKEAVKEFKCHLHFLRLGNIYLKRMCFENGIDYFLENTKQEYFFYHYVLAAAAQLAQEHGFDVDELYFELCKRKNIFYLGEMWQRQGSSASDINKLLEKDFTPDELRAAIPSDSMLLDFFYVRIFYMDEEFVETQIDSRKNSTCIAFSMTPDSNVKIHFVSDGIKLAENMRSDKFVPYFKRITERLLDGADKTTRVIVCTEGDLNQLSFAALPYLDGFVTDRYAVRNIASVFDIVYTREKKDLKDALVVSAPDFGSAGEHGTIWLPLFMSKREGEIISGILADEHGIEYEHLSTDEATAENISAKLANRSYGIVHISTHGFFEDGKVYIVTAGANENREGKDKTAISDSDFAEFPFEDTALATYALCFGARQSLILQDSLSGFIKASLLAGANTILAPVAPIPDLSTAIFMGEFYERYLTNCKDESTEITLQKTIAAIRTMSKQELLEKYHIEIEQDFPFADVRHWGNWVCFSAETMLRKNFENHLTEDIHAG